MDSSESLTELMKQAEHCGRGSPRLSLRDRFGRLFVTPAVAASLLHADVEPDGRIEAGLLREHEVREIIAEVFGVRLGLEIAVVPAPFGDGIDNSVTSCATLDSRSGEPILPWKYLLATMLVAVCDQSTGTSMSRCSKMTAPLSLPILALRISHGTRRKGSFLGAAWQ